MALLTIVETPEFVRRSRAAGMTDDEREQLIALLAADPEAGISLGGGLRKLRFARSGGGKSGGYRVIHFYQRRDMPLFLLTVFGKNEQANISAAEQNALVKLCDLIAQSYGH
jgi:hypothetical protein